ncbi:MAG TPA: bi-domain-containing oxidoreductase [Rudaea sp.]|nr:bi-domain-containing oxidoreductase [Rudaea sp.]
MKQILQDLRHGATAIADVPAPGARAGHVLIRTRATLVSAGTERMLVEFGKAGWLERARRQPDKVRMVIDKIRTDGIAAAWQAVQSKLDEPLALGYCNVGEVIEVGAGVEGFAVGDRVVSNGKHAEIVCVPKHLCARVPEGVEDAQAAFTVLGAIALQGVRLAQPTLGENVVVIGLGLIGLLSVQVLRAHGCRVMGLDPDASRRALACELGADAAAESDESAIAHAQAFSRGRGVDAVIVAASTSSNEPMHLAARMCRKRGRVVLVGVAGLELSRADFYEKELSFQVSCSYGPGRYDPSYEEAGQDYPIGFVRWTEQRNFEAVLDLLAAGKLAAEPLISRRLPFERAGEAYELLASDAPVLGLLLEFPAAAPVTRTIALAGTTATAPGARVAFLGAGNYAGRTLVPAFRAAGAALRTIVSAAGVSAAHLGRKYGFVSAGTDWHAAVDDANVDAVVVATRHGLHAEQALAALRAGKHVFCEKPLCLTLDELAALETEMRARPGQLVMVGFNRRFAPLAVALRERLANLAQPKSFVYTVNAGTVPATHWTRDKAVGGGRIVGEACHFVDLLRHLAGAPVVRWQATRVRGDATADADTTIVLEFADGSTGTVHYSTSGHRSFPKERLEVFCAGRVFELDNFRRLRAWGEAGIRGWRQDKGQNACAAAFVAAIRNGGAAPIPIDDIVEVSRIGIELQQQVDG